MHYGYIYKITNLIDGKIYVGLHSKPTFDESYWGSGSDLHDAKTEYGLENFSREVLQWCDSLEELNIAEQYWIDHLDARNPEVGYNIQPGGVCSYGYAHRESTRRRLSEKAKKREPYGFWINNGIIEKYNKFEDSIPEGFVKGRLAAPMKRMGAKRRGKTWHKRNPSKAKGTHWYTNGSIDIMADKCPDGFTPGRTHHVNWSGSNNPSYGRAWNKGIAMSADSKEKLSQTRKKQCSENPRRWITDGKVEKLHPRSESIPEGFVAGRLVK